MCISTWKALGIVTCIASIVSGTKSIMQSTKYIHRSNTQNTEGTTQSTKSIALSTIDSAQSIRTCSKCINRGELGPSFSTSGHNSTME